MILDNVLNKNEPINNLSSWDFVLSHGLLLSGPDSDITGRNHFSYCIGCWRSFEELLFTLLISFERHAEE